MKTMMLWNPVTGIVDMPEVLKRRQAEELFSVKLNWQNLQLKLKDEGLFDVFIERMKRDWAIETGLIERLYSMTRGMTQTLIEYGFKEGLLKHGSHDKSERYILNLLEDQKNSMEMVFQAIKDERPFTTSFIKELHASFTRSQEDVEAQDSAGNVIKVALKRGEWKSQPNFPVRDGVKFLYCPPEQTASEMDRLIGYFDAQKTLAPEVRAAFLHHRFTLIHPFQDGNGRVSRAIASLILVKEGLFPLHVRDEVQGKYIAMLEEADKGNLVPFVDFIVGLQVEEYLKAEGLYYEIRKSDFDLVKNEIDQKYKLQTIISDLHHLKFDRREEWSKSGLGRGKVVIDFSVDMDKRVFKCIDLKTSSSLEFDFIISTNEKDDARKTRFSLWLDSIEATLWKRENS